MDAWFWFVIGTMVTVVIIVGFFLLWWAARMTAG